MAQHSYWLVLVLFFCSPAVVAELSLTYDANGNLVTGDGKFREYNSLNQLWKVYNGSTNTTLLQEYVYDPIEERVAVKRTYNSSGSTIETVYYFSEEFVRVVNSTGTFDFTYVYHEGQLIAQNNGSTTFFIHGNHEGSSSVVTNSSGSVVERTEYSPYGEVLSGGNSTRFNYEGEEYDRVLGDTDFDARRYKQDWALFEQPDGIFAQIFNPQSLNRYMFELANPLKHKDEDGHEPVIGSGEYYNDMRGQGGQVEDVVWKKALILREQTRANAAEKLEGELRAKYEPAEIPTVIAPVGSNGYQRPTFEDLQQTELSSTERFDIDIDEYGVITSYNYNGQRYKNTDGLLDKGFTNHIVDKRVNALYKEKTGHGKPGTISYRVYQVKAKIMKIGSKLFAVFVKPKAPPPKK